MVNLADKKWFWNKDQKTWYGKAAKAMATMVLLIAFAIGSFCTAQGDLVQYGIHSAVVHETSGMKMEKPR